MGTLGAASHQAPKRCSDKSAKYFKCLSSALAHSRHTHLQDKLTKGRTVTRTQIQKNLGVEAYRLSFGRFKGWTIERVMKKSPGYFASLVQRTSPRDLFYHDKPDLKEKLIQEGLWDRILTQAEMRMNKPSTSTPTSEDIVEFMENESSEDYTESDSEE